MSLGRWHRSRYSFHPKMYRLVSLSPLRVAHLGHRAGTSTLHHSLDQCSSAGPCYISLRVKRHKQSSVTNLQFTLYRSIQFPQSKMFLITTCWQRNGIRKSSIVFFCGESSRHVVVVVRSGSIVQSFCMAAPNCAELDRVVIAFHPKAEVNDDGR